MASKVVRIENITFAMDDVKKTVSIMRMLDNPGYPQEILTNVPLQTLFEFMEGLEIGKDPAPEWKGPLHDAVLEHTPHKMRSDDILLEMLETLKRIEGRLP